MSNQTPAIVEVTWEHWNWGPSWEHPQTWRRVICLFKGHFWRVLRVNRGGLARFLETPDRAPLTEKRRAAYLAHPEWITRWPVLHHGRSEAYERGMPRLALEAHCEAQCLRCGAHWVSPQLVRDD